MTDEKWQQRTRQRLNFFMCARESEVSARVTKRNSKKMETFAFNIFSFLSSCLFESISSLLSHAATAINCRKSASSCSQCWDNFCVRSQQLISSHSTSDDICKFRFRLSYFLLCAIKKVWVWESSAIWWKIATTCCMNERVLWDILTDNCYVLSLCCCCFGVPVPDFHSFFISFPPSWDCVSEIICFHRRKKSELSANERTIRV